MSYIAGNFHGLTVDFYVRSYKNLSLYNSLWGGSGAIVRIDNVSHIIDHIRDGIFISPGTSTFLGLNREYKTILPKPYSNCLVDSYDKSTNIDSDLYQLIKKSSYDYTQIFCLEQCLMKLYNDNCKCMPSSFLSTIDSKFCFSDYDLNCANYLFFNVFLKSDYIQNFCLSRCPLECYSNKFTYSSSSFDINGDLYVTKIQNNSNLAINYATQDINVEGVGKSIVRINVFYESLSYSISEELPQWDSFSLIANIGGNLGLFMGVSFFSLCEIITTFIELYFFRKENKKIDI